MSARQKSDLRDYQQRVVTALYEHDQLQAVLPMGAGKTAAALTAVQELLDDGEIRCALVLAPKKVAQLVWPAETRLWEHLKGLRVQLVAGPPERRLQQFEQPADVYVIGVDNTKWLVENVLAKLPAEHPLFDCLIIDELSRFKNPRSKRARTLMKVRRHFKNVWGLTGTPRPNGYEDQFKPLTILTNGRLWGKVFGTWQATRFQRMKRDEEGNLLVASDAIPEAAVVRTLRPEWMQRTLDEINSVSITIGPDDMPELPELTTVFHWVELPRHAQRLYDQMQRDLIAALRATRTITAANMGVATGKLSQLAQGFIYGEGGNEDVEHVHTEKVDLLVELTESLEENALIAYEFVEDLRVLHELYPDLPYLGAGVSDARTAQHEAQWNAGSLHRLALHPASAGHGLNLQHGGSQMFWFSMTWSAELYDQTIKRFHRPGQKKRCFNHLILAKNTIDEAKYDRVINKMSAQEAFIRYMRKV